MEDGTQRAEFGDAERGPLSLLKESKSDQAVARAEERLLCVASMVSSPWKKVRRKEVTSDTTPMCRCCQGDL